MTITDHRKRLSPAALNFWIQTFALIAIFFEGVSGILVTATDPCSMIKVSWAVSNRLRTT
jgi:hypothetical protein